MLALLRPIEDSHVSIRCWYGAVALIRLKTSVKPTLIVLQLVAPNKGAVQLMGFDTPRAKYDALHVPSPLSVSVMDARTVRFPHSAPAVPPPHVSGFPNQPSSRDCLPERTFSRTVKTKHCSCHFEGVYYS